MHHSCCCCCCCFFDNDLPFDIELKWKTKQNKKKFNGISNVSFILFQSLWSIIIIIIRNADFFSIFDTNEFQRSSGSKTKKKINVSLQMSTSDWWGGKKKQEKKIHIERIMRSNSLCIKNPCVCEIFMTSNVITCHMWRFSKCQIKWINLSHPKKKHPLSGGLTMIRKPDILKNFFVPFLFFFWLGEDINWQIYHQKKNKIHKCNACVCVCVCVYINCQ